MNAKEKKMSVRLRVKNFGPISFGYRDNDGFVEFQKVTLFCGPQGSGKSTITKIFSTFSWLEKSVYRDDDFVIDDVVVADAIRWQNIGDYLRSDSELEYDGDLVHIKFSKGRVICEKKADCAGYLKPKISYMPAERNFVSIAQGAVGANLLPQPLIGMQTEFGEAKRFFKGRYALPSNGFSFSYDESTQTSWIYNGEQKTHLEQASSGLQSMVPLLMVSDYLSSQIRPDVSGISLSGLMATDLRNSREDEARRVFQDRVMRSALSENDKRSSLERYFSPGKCLLNIVEEPEQNLYPAAQYKVVKQLLKNCNLFTGNRLVMSTHSPFVVNTMVLSSMVEKLYAKISSKTNRDLFSRLTQLESRDCAIKQSDMALYEFMESGELKKLEVEGGLFSDANVLNAFLEEWNDHFDELLEIEEAVDGR